MRKETLSVDFCVVGGGLAGLMAAVAAARGGAKVALMQDRPVLGGNCSSEIRMWVRGARGDQNHEGGLLEELELNSIARNPRCNFSLWDAELYNLAAAEPNLTLLMNCSCLDAEVRDGALVSVTGWQLTTYTYVTVQAKLFADCSGDAILSDLTGASVRVGREARDEFGEDIEPEKADRKTMGLSCLIQARETDGPVKFVPPPFADIFPDASSFPYRTVDLKNSSENYWWMELGGAQDSLRDTEAVKKRLLALAYGVWDHVKNRGDYGADNWALEWVGFLPGKRESRRYVCDHTMTQQEVQAGGKYEDIVAYGGWALDDHHPDGFDYPGPPNINHPAPTPYGIPYRSLCVRDLKNLFCAGRCIGVTHIALSAVRVMATCALEGQAIGTAAAMAAARGCGIREIPIRALQERLMEDGCYLPGLTRTVSELTRAAECSLSPERREILLDGYERDLDGITHHIGLAPDETVAFRWKKPVFIGTIRLMLDTDLSRASVSSDPVLRRFPMRCNEPLDFPGVRVPATLAKTIRAELVRPDGTVRTLEVRDNHQGLLRLPADENAVELRLSFPETNGADKAGVFSLDLLG